MKSITMAIGLLVIAVSAAFAAPNLKASGDLTASKCCNMKCCADCEGKDDCCCGGGCCK